VPYLAGTLLVLHIAAARAPSRRSPASMRRGSTRREWRATASSPLCLPEDEGCLAQARAIAAGKPHAREETMELARTVFGRSGVPQRFTILLAPPMK
jgi:hypothetical protein